MPLPLLFLGAAAAAGAGVFGVGNTIKAGIDNNKANKLNKSANEILEEAQNRTNAQREACGRALNHLGKEKIYVLNSTVTEFLDTFQKIKNVDFRETEGLEELRKFHIDEHDFEEMRLMANYAGAIGVGAFAGTAGGAAIAAGAYGLAHAFAAASTGTAIASLNGVAATNATLAFFGGGSLAAGGMGMAGGAMVLGGFVAGPALMVMGLIVGNAAKKNLMQAVANQEEAIQVAAEVKRAELQCEAIRRRTNMFYTLLARLDTYFLPFIYRLEDVLESEGEDYRAYSTEAKKITASCASIAVTIKSVLDTPLLTDDGILTTASQGTVTNVEAFLSKMRIQY